MTAALVLDDVAVARRHGDVVASMRVGGAAERLVLRRHDSEPEMVDRSGTPFLPVATLLAALQGRDLRIDADVDEIALSGALRAGTLLASWWGWRAPQITAAARTPAAPRAQDTGLFFSRGLDSMATLVQQRGRVTALLGMDWQDPPLATEGTAAIWESTRAAAGEARLPLIRLSTNVRRHLDPLVAWDLSHGAVLATLALLAAPSIGTALVSGTHPAGREAPHGINPRLDPLWSSSRMRIEHASGGGGRNEKAALVAGDAFATRWLKVCWERAGDGNCGRCAKCLMTMTNFRIAGALDAVGERFDAELSPDAVRAVVAGARLTPQNVQSLLDRLDPGDPLYEPWRQMHAAALEYDRDVLSR